LEFGSRNWRRFRSALFRFRSPSLPEGRPTEVPPAPAGKDGDPSLWRSRGPFEDSGAGLGEEEGDLRCRAFDTDTVLPNLRGEETGSTPRNRQASPPPTRLRRGFPPSASSTPHTFRCENRNRGFQKTRARILLRRNTILPHAPASERTRVLHLFPGGDRWTDARGDERRGTGDGSSRSRGQWIGTISRSYGGTACGRRRF